MSGRNVERPKWTRSLTGIAVAAAAAALVGFLADGKAVTTDRQYFRSSAGSVLFDHGKHSTSAESCAKCHHDLYAAEQAVTCQECHDDELEPSEFSHGELKEIHSRDCAKCHEQVGEADQAMSCRECHPGMQESKVNTLSCTECHEDDFTPDMMAHDEYLEVSDHTCTGCHAPKSVSEVYHTNCTSCHLETSGARFANADGDVLCGACHLQ